MENLPGKSAREMQRNRRKRRQVIGLIAIGVLLVGCIGCWLSLGGPVLLTTCVLLLFLCLLAFTNYAIIPAMAWLFHREKQAEHGAIAEEDVGAMLEALPGCVVLHDVDTGQGNIDHLVFRPDGAVLLIETKSHRGRITEAQGELRRDGKPLEKDFLRQAHGNIAWLRAKLKREFGVEAWIQAAIVFPSAFVAVRRTLRGVDVINAGFLNRWLARAPGNVNTAKALWPQRERLKALFKS